MPETIDHTQNCDDCKEIEKEHAMTDAYRQAINQDFEKILDRKLQIQATTLERVTKLEKAFLFLIAYNIIEKVAIFFFIYKYFHK